jgi:hypothetical protein
MKKNIILQHFDGELRELDKFSIENIKAYAKLIGSDYELITGKPFHKHLTSPCQKVYCIDKHWDNYETVLMLDIDVFTRKNLQINIFEIPGNGIHGSTQTKLKEKLIKLGKIKPNNPYWAGSIYKFNLDERQLLRSVMPTNADWMNVFNQPYYFEDEGILAQLASNAKIKETYLDFSWNQCSFLPKPEKANMIHIRTKITPQGPKRLKIENYMDLVQKGVI